jgi:hypothetical protein
MFLGWVGGRGQVSWNLFPASGSEGRWAEKESGEGIPFPILPPLTKTEHPTTVSFPQA